MILRLAVADIPERLAPLPVWMSQILFSLFCAAGMVLLRLAVDAILPGAGPFGLVFPAILLATIYGRWLSGVITLVLVLAYAWFLLLPQEYSFTLANAGNNARIIVIGFSGLLVVFLAEVMRRAFRAAVDERNAKIEEQTLLLREIDHRMRNNFTIVSGLLALQRQQVKDAGTRDALETAETRVNSIARAHKHLYSGAGNADVVDMQLYISELCQALSDALFARADVVLDCKCEPITLPRDRAVSVGLLVNELVTNAAKHAFKGRDSGEILVRVEKSGAGYRLTVQDNGVGMSGTARDGALGLRLIDAFGKQANGKMTSQSGANGTRFVLELAP